MPVIVFDLIIAAILLIFFLRGYRKGFILSLCGLVAMFVALFGAFYISNSMAQPVADAIRPAVEECINHVLVEGSEVLKETTASLEDVLADLLTSKAEELPEGGLPTDELFSILQDNALLRGFAESFRETVGTGVAQTTDTLVRALAEYTSLMLARTLLFLLSFAGILVVWTLLSHALDLAFKLPVLSTLNRWAGAALGLGEALALLFILFWLLGDMLITKEMVEGSYLLPIFFSANPLEFILSALGS